MIVLHEALWVTVASFASVSIRHIPFHKFWGKARGAQLRAAWYWTFLLSMGGFLLDEFRRFPDPSKRLPDSFRVSLPYYANVPAHVAVWLSYLMTAYHLYQFRHCRRIAEEVVDYIFDILLLPVSFGLLSLHCIRILPDRDGKDLWGATATLDAAEVWESWALWSFQTLFMRYVDGSEDAQALKSATHMMAVSNSKLSIYTRIWCVYEAYLAYKWDKTIFTAVAPDRPERLWAAARMLISLAAGTLTALALIWWGGHTALSSMLQPFQTSHIVCVLGPDIQAIVLVVLACFSQSMLQPGLAWRSINMFGVASTSMSLVFILYLAQEGHWASVVMTGPAKLLLRMLLPLLLVFFVLSEVDCLRLARAHREADQLAVYSCVTGAESSNEEDRHAILSDIGDKVDAVNKSIRVLLDAGMSTLGLRSAAELGVDVAGAAEQRLAVGWAGLSKWCLFTVFFCTELGDHNFELLGEARYNKQLPQLYHKVEFYLTACCIVCYAVIWAASGPDKKAFLLSALFKLLVLMAACFPLVVIAFNCLRKGRCSCAWHRMWESRPWGLGALYAALFGILAVLCAARGLSGLARIPCIGRHLASALAPGCRLYKCCSRRAAKRPRGPSGRLEV